VKPTGRMSRPEGAILAQPASPVRAPEARFAQAALAELGIPIIRALTGSATMEGADCLWLDAQTVVIGEGIRTNAAGARCLAEALAPMEVTVRSVPVPPGAQHLLGVVVPLDRDLAVVDSERVSPQLAGLLRDHGVQTISLPPDAENRERRGMNGVVLGPREWVMPEGCPGIQDRLESGIPCSLETGDWRLETGDWRLEIVPQPRRKPRSDPEHTRASDPSVRAEGRAGCSGAPCSSGCSRWTVSNVRCVISPCAYKRWCFRRRRCGCSTVSSRHAGGRHSRGLLDEPWVPSTGSVGPAASGG
jgi:hypothetical protein